MSSLTVSRPETLPTGPPHRKADSIQQDLIRQVVFFDMSYTLAMFRERGLTQALEARRLGGFFSRVISVHPLAGVVQQGRGRFGRPGIQAIGPGHIFIEGKAGRFGLPRWLAPLDLLWAQLQMVAAVFRQTDRRLPTVIRAGDPYYLGLLGLGFARLLRAPLILRIPFRYDEVAKKTNKAVHPRLFRWRWIEKAIERFVLPRADLVAGANQDNLDYALENGARPERGTVFRYGNLLHPAHWEPPSGRAFPSMDSQSGPLCSKKYLILVSRLEAEKKVEDALQALRRLQATGSVPPLLIVGDGSRKEFLLQTARQLRVDSCVHFAGIRDQTWIAGALAHATLALSPHMGRALTEAALAGIPVVAYDYDWQRELIQSGHTGILVPDGRWELMAEAARHLLQNPVQAARMAEALRVRTASMMDPESLREHEVRKIQEVAGSYSQTSRNRKWFSGSFW